MTPEERRILAEAARELARKLQDSIVKASPRKELRITLNPQPPQHPNCRSLYIQQVGRALRPPVTRTLWSAGSLCPTL